MGLAAGFDKDAKLYEELSNFGFGFIEIGNLNTKGTRWKSKEAFISFKKRSCHHQQNGI